MEGDGVVKQPAGVDARLRHAQTQHGHYSTVDEENIVVLQRCFTPPPLEEEAAKEVVWFEEVMISEITSDSARPASGRRRVCARHMLAYCSFRTSELTAATVLRG
uniref:Uncharacterized protein n=1 Tax=Anopheles merus TaxID=30066 RepID=A0A182UYY1_ANOME